MRPLLIGSKLGRRAEWAAQVRAASLRAVETDIAARWRERPNLPASKSSSFAAVASDPEVHRRAYDAG
jgi:hypothetical protein